MSTITLNGVQIPNLSQVIIHSAYNKANGEIKQSLIDNWLLNAEMREASKFINLMKGTSYIGDAPYVDAVNTPPPFANQTSATVKSVEMPYFQFSQQIFAHDILTKAQQIVMSSGVMSNELTYAQAYAICVNDSLRINVIAHNNRKRKMLSEVFTTGKLVIAGTDHAKHRTIDFERDATATFAPSTTWDNSSANIVADIKSMIDIYRGLNDRSPQAMLVRADVYSAMISNAGFKAEFITPHAGISVQNMPASLVNDDLFGNLAMQLRGATGGSLLDIWVYDANYIDKTGAKQYMLPNGGVYMTEYPSESSSYVARFSPIENFNAFNYSAAEAFTQVLPKDDGKMVEVLSQQGFLIVPNNVNSVVGGANFLGSI
jgi:hypothetical protein